MKLTIALIGMALSCSSFISTSFAENTKEKQMTAFEMGFFAIPVADISAAKKFYGPVMGWDFNDRDPKFSYILANGNMIGALETATDSFKPSSNGPLLYFRADFMTNTLDRVKANGGKVKEKVTMEDGARGYTAKVSDPAGNTIGFWAPED